MTDLHPQLAKVLISEDQLQTRIRELGGQITRDYQGQEVLLVCILKGAFLFLADLCRSIDLPQKVEFMAISSYGHATESSGVVRIIKDLNESIEDKHVIVVEDICDTGLTLSYLAGILRGRNPRSLKICVLCDKPQCHKKDVPIDYCGFVLPNEFVVGYGLDFKDLLRNLPYIGVLKPEMYRGS